MEKESRRRYKRNEEVEKVKLKRTKGNEVVEGETRWGEVEKG